MTQVLLCSACELQVNGRWRWLWWGKRRTWHVLPSWVLILAPPEVPRAQAIEHLPKSLHSSGTPKRHPDLRLHTIILEPESRNMVFRD